MLIGREKKECVGTKYTVIMIMDDVIIVVSASTSVNTRLKKTVH